MQGWKLYCEKPPKGFEKYFKPSGAGSSKLEDKLADKNDATGKEAKKDTKSDAPPSKSTPPPPPNRPTTPKAYEQWSFGLFGGPGSRYEINFTIFYQTTIYFQFSNVAQC